LSSRPRSAPSHLFTPPSLFLHINPPTSMLYTLSLHDALPISSICCGARRATPSCGRWCCSHPRACCACRRRARGSKTSRLGGSRSEEHTSELQSLAYLVCRLLLEKKKIEHKKKYTSY